MADHIWTVLCKEAIIDGDSNNVSLINVLEQVVMIAPPKVQGQEESLPEHIPLSMSLVTLWARSELGKKEIFESRTILKSPAGKMLSTQEHSINLKTHVRFRVRTNINIVGFAGFGRYLFLVQKKTSSGKWSRVASVPLDVIRGEASEQIH